MQANKNFEAPQKAVDQKIYAPWSGVNLRLIKNKQYGLDPISHCNAPLRVTELGLRCVKCEFAQNWFLASEVVA